jgi:outer membrane protein TolC
LGPQLPLKAGNGQTFIDRNMRHRNRDDLVLKALKTHPDLLAAQQGVRAAGSQYALARADGNVDVTGALTAQFCLPMTGQ